MYILYKIIVVQTTVCKIKTSHWLKEKKITIYFRIEWSLESSSPK